MSTSESTSTRPSPSIAALPELGEVWGWLEAVRAAAPAGAVPEDVDRVPDLGEAWAWMDLIRDPELKAAAAEARGDSELLATGPDPDPAAAWRCLLGTAGEFGCGSTMSNRFAALYESSDDEDDSPDPVDFGRAEYSSATTLLRPSGDDS